MIFAARIKSILWARDLKTKSGFASASILIRTRDDSPTNTGGLSLTGHSETRLVSQASCDAIPWFSVDMVCDFCVSPIVPSRKTLYPASPFLQWVAKVSLPHLPVQQSVAELRYYDPLRLPNVYLRFVRSSLSSPDTLYCARKHLDLPSSRATPLNTCPGLRPRWCPEYLP